MSTPTIGSGPGAALAELCVVPGAAIGAATGIDQGVPDSASTFQALVDDVLATVGRPVVDETDDAASPDTDGPAGVGVDVTPVLNPMLPVLFTPPDPSAPSSPGRALGKLAGPADPHAAVPGDRGRALGRIGSTPPPANVTESTAPVVAAPVVAAPAAAAPPGLVTDANAAAPAPLSTAPNLAPAGPTASLSADEAVGASPSAMDDTTPVPSPVDAARLPTDPACSSDTRSRPADEPGENPRPVSADVASDAPPVAPPSADPHPVSTSSTNGLPVVVPTISTTTAAAPTPTPTPTPTSNPVTTQVVDKVTSLFSNGNGTHRITLDLNPENLGQVRVVMTVRDGAVHVRLAAGERGTRAALIDGEADLKTLLGLAGASDTKVTVRELGNAFGAQHQTQNQAQTPSQQNPAPQQGATPDQHAASRDGTGPQDQHARTRVHDPATDGTTNPRRVTAAGATGLRSSETVTSGRFAGVDVTM